MPSTRRFLTVLVLELKYAGAAIQRLDPDEIQTGFELFWHSFYRFVTDEEGIPLPPQSQEFVALFGAETPYADHAVRAAKAAAAITTWLREWAFKFSQTGREIPHFSVALHSGETVAMQIPGTESVPWAVVGEAVVFVRTLVRVCRADEVICSEPFLSAFLGALPSGHEFLEIATGQEPDLSGLNWDVADFVPLEDNLRNKTILVGNNVREQPDSASLWFTYFYAFSDPDSAARARVIGVFFSGSIPSLENSTALADTGAQFRRFGKYRLLRALGHGGMGTVWLGQDGFGNHAAIKTILESIQSEATQITRFEREAKVMSQLSHRNICRIIEMSEYDGTRFIAMEYISGVTLADLLENVPDDQEHPNGSSPKGAGQPDDLPSLVLKVRGKKLRDELRKKRRSSDQPLPVLRLGHSLALFLKICDAVQFAHGKGVLHRDLKPANVLIREDGDPVVSDFGLAKLRHANDGFEVSHTGQVLGTLAYMAPEQAQSSKEVDERADVFSLGAILYRMLCGADQFRTSGNFAADVQMLQSHEPAPPSRIRRAIPKDMEAIVMKALGQEPASRYRSVQALADDIARFQAGEPIHARPPTTSDLARKLYVRHRVIVNASGVAIAFALLMLVFALWRITGERNEALKARKSAEIAEAKALDLLEKYKSSESEKSEMKVANTALSKDNSELKKLKDLKAKKPVKPYAETLLPAGASPDAVADAAINDVVSRLRDLAENPKLRNAVVVDSGDGKRGKFPSDVLTTLGAATESAAKARIVAPASAGAWIAAGWCALLDFDPESAQRDFRKAMDAADSPPLKDRCEKLVGASEFFSSSEAADIGMITDRLMGTQNPDDKVVARVVGMLRNAIKIDGGLPPSIGDFRKVLALTPGVCEIAALFLETNPQAVLNIDIEDAPGGIPQLYVNGKGVSSLKVLEGVFARFQNAAPEKSWQLNASHTSAPEIPALPVSAVTASDSGVSRLRISDAFPLASVDLSSSQITDLSELLRSRTLEDCRLNSCQIDRPELLFDPSRNLFAKTLKVLEIVGVKMTSLQGINNLTALECFRFSPELVGDRASIARLRDLPSLRRISAVNEPEDQTAAEFWRLHPEFR